MQRRRGEFGLLQIGAGLIAVGIAVKVALWLGAFLSPFAGVAIGVGLLLVILGLVLPRKGL